MGIQPKSEISALPGRIFRQGITGCGGSRTHVTARVFVPGPGSHQASENRGGKRTKGHNRAVLLAVRNEREDVAWAGVEVVKDAMVVWVVGKLGALRRTGSTKQQRC